MESHADARMRRRGWRLALGSLGLAVLAGCAGPRVRIPVLPRPAPGYEARIDSLDLVDPEAVRGRRIALDPGHGGRFPGSMGVNGFSEAAANLAVAARLRDLLAARGATVFLTRETDRDFLSPADSSLRADLTERMRLVNAFAPDLFVSIHHNADAGGAHDVNETQTYYRLGDDGPSLDAAESVHRFLVRNLGIEAHRILPGNYFVLRGTDAPALLTESSYITNPDVEAKLVLPEKQRLEAEALYLGIAHYFSRGAPVVESFVAKAAPDAAPDTAFGDIAAPRFEALVRGAFDDAVLEIDGAPARLERFGQRLAGYARGVLDPGPHEAVLRVRRAGAAAARPVRLGFTIAPEVARVTAEAWPARVSPGDAPVAVRFAFQDRLGRFVRDTLTVRAAWKARRGTIDTLLAVRDGVAWARVPAGAAGTLAFSLHAVGDSARIWSAAAEIEAAPDTAAPWRGVVHAVTGTAGAEGHWAPLAEPLREARGTAEPARVLTWLNREGFAVLPRGPRGAVIVPRLAGYRAWPDSLAPAADGVPVVHRVPIAMGALHGRRITLDPDGGGADAAGIGKSGTRGANVNLRVARVLAGFLAAAGAAVRMTRAGDEGLSDIQRVQISEAFRSDRFLRIGHRSHPPRLGHYFSSDGGRAWAARTGAAFERLGLPRPPIEEDAQYPLQQTSCPALYASVARVDSAATEEALLAPGALRAEAYALYLGLLGEWSAGAEMPVDSVRVLDAEGRPVAGAAVTLGDALLLESDERGIVRFARTEPVPVEVSVADSRVNATRVLLDSARGVILTGPRGR
jgi:N-acetylmuramoyl-L-alanine amidase